MKKDVISEARDAFKECEEAEGDNRKRALDDLRFARLGEQWDEGARSQREKEGRPCLTINKMPAFIRQVVNDARQNKPSIKIHPVDSKADIETAKIMDGIIRNIEYISNADVAYDTAIDFSASMGVGYWRVVVDYARDDTFEKDILIKRVSNPFTVYGDPRSEAADSSDWNVAFVTEMVKRSEFKKLYPDADPLDWKSDSWDYHDWVQQDDIRVAEYWTRDKVKKSLLLLSDGTVMSAEDFETPDEDGVTPRDIAFAENITVVRERETEGYKVTQRLITAVDELEVTPWMGRFIPVVPVYGEELNIEGERHWLSLIHQAKDAQRMFNYWRTASTELVALAPKAPFIGPKGAFVTDIDKWETANTETHPFIEYDGNVAPQRQPFSGVPAGALQEALNASDDMKAMMGIYDASLGARSNETSGRAIMARQREGDTSTFHFIDNLNRAIRHTGRIVLDLIPHVYNDARIMRIMGEDGSHASVPVNQPVIMTPQGPQPAPPNLPPEMDGKLRKFDLTLGKYDLTVSSGPSFTTRREEAAYQMTEMIRAFPQAAAVIGPHLAKNLDWPGADEIAEDLKLLSPANQAQQPQQPDPRIAAKQAELELKQRESALQLKLKREEAAANIEIERERLALKRAEAKEDALMQREKMRLQREQAEFEAELKRDNHEIDKKCMMEKHTMTMRQNRQMLEVQRAADLGVELTDEEGNSVFGDDMQVDKLMQAIDVLVTNAAQTNQVLGHLAQSNQQIAGALDGIARTNDAVTQALDMQNRISMAEVTLIRDDKGKAIGSRKVIN